MLQCSTTSEFSWSRVSASSGSTRENNVCQRIKSKAQSHGGTRVLVAIALCYFSEGKGCDDALPQVCSFADLICIWIGFTRNRIICNQTSQLGKESSVTYWHAHFVVWGGISSRAYWCITVRSTRSKCSTAEHKDPGLCPYPCPFRCGRTSYQSAFVDHLLINFNSWITTACCTLVTSG